MSYAYKIYNLQNPLHIPVLITSRVKLVALVKMAWSILSTYGKCSTADSERYDVEIVNKEGVHILGITEEELLEDLDTSYSTL